MVAVGEVWKHVDFYTDSDTAELLPKYLLILAVHANKDITYRLLTSRPYNRVAVPACDHNEDRPGYYIGVPQPNPPLNKETWVDLRETDDFDALDFQKKVDNSVLTRVYNLDPAILCPTMSCAAYAQDTTKAQKNHIMQARQALGCH